MSTRRLAVGSVTALRPGFGAEYAVLFVNRAGHHAWERAYEERDEKGMSRVFEIYETLKLYPDETVRVVQIDGLVAQVEYLASGRGGRRGWIEISSFGPPR